MYLSKEDLEFITDIDDKLEGMQMVKPLREWWDKFCVRAQDALPQAILEEEAPLTDPMPDVESYHMTTFGPSHDVELDTLDSLPRIKVEAIHSSLPNSRDIWIKFDKTVFKYGFEGSDEVKGIMLSTSFCIQSDNRLILSEIVHDESHTTVIHTFEISHLSEEWQNTIDLDCLYNIVSRKQ